MGVGEVLLVVDEQLHIARKATAAAKPARVLAALLLELRAKG